MPVIHNTFVIDRRFAASPARVFAAFSDPEKKQRWLGDGEHHDLEEFTLDFRVGGMERARYRFRPGTPFPGMPFMMEGSFQDIVPEQRIVMVSTMTMGERRISVTLATVELAATENGTLMTFTHQGAFFEGSDGPERRQAGWEVLFAKIEKELAS